EQHLVEVGHLELAPEDSPHTRRAHRVERVQFVAGGGLRNRWPDAHAGPSGWRHRAPHGIGVGLALVICATGWHRRRLVLRAPALNGVLVVLVEQQTLL